jgi:hypothetical protein
MRIARVFSIKNFFCFPKTEDHYVAPARWQDFAFQAIFWTANSLLLFATFRLIRFALKPRESL